MPDNALMDLPQNSKIEINVPSKNGTYRVIIDNNSRIYILLDELLGHGNSSNATLAQLVLMKENQFVNGGWVVAKEEFVNQPTKIANECMMLHLMKNLVGISIFNNKIISFQKL